ncbi:PEP-CTERM sorting domain-containing protein [Paludisphaera borealis]|uniref:PEP-CTERM protein-sorting domain-containing protein n=1 Tax=Paludisphaera borealis TaxID=1387353 RepID=A0A1U7CS53_9BACT|nr:PEP-CTERM sorting domain-containing protein [Paludisphaera borealis]APW61726.1 hypothetical protein BSF38_03254 [Paludisphaera borealis]
MRQVAWLVCLASSVVLGGIGRAHASPLKLQIWGNAHNLQILPNDPVTIDVTDGFSGFTRSGGQILQHGSDSENWQKPVDSAMQIWASLSDGDRTLAWAQFSAPVEGSLSYVGMFGRYSGSAQGSAAGVVSIGQGVDPSLIPSWFTGLTATVQSQVTGGYLNNFESTLTLTTDAAPVPEPSSVLVFLAAAGCVGYRRVRRAAADRLNGMRT